MVKHRIWWRNNASSVYLYASYLEIYICILALRRTIIWDLTEPFTEKPFPHISHFYHCIFALRWTLMWELTDPFTGKPFPHISHFYHCMLALRWTIMWDLTELFTEKPFPHISHLKGFSPVCFLVWISRWEAKRKTLPQTLHGSMRRDSPFKSSLSEVMRVFLPDRPGARQERLDMHFKFWIFYFFTFYLWPLVSNVSINESNKWQNTELGR